MSDPSSQRPARKQPADPREWAEEITLDAEDDAILDQIWAEARAEKARNAALAAGAEPAAAQTAYDATVAAERAYDVATAAGVDAPSCRRAIREAVRLAPLAYATRREAGDDHATAAAAAASAAAAVGPASLPIPPKP